MPTSSLSSLRRQPRFAHRRVRLLAAGVTVSSLAFAARGAAQSPQLPFRVGDVPRGWLNEGEPDRLELPTSTAAPRVRGELFFIDADVADPSAFWLSAPAGATVVCIPAGVDSWEFMAREAAQFRGLGAIHIISHGDRGTLVLNRHRYSAADLGARSGALQRLGRALSKNGDILLYGCDTGAGVEGTLLVNRLAEFTGADVGASANPTGGMAGADWHLEVTHGDISTALLAPEHYEHDLHTASVSTIPQLKAAISTGSSDSVDDTITITGDLTFASAADAITVGVTDGHTLTIVGGGHAIDGNNLARVFNVVTSGAGSAVVIDGLTIKNGFVTGAGGDRQAGAGGAGGDALGGNLSNAGSLTIKNSTITAGKAAGGGGGGGDVYSGGSSCGAGGGGGGFGSTVGGTGGTNFGATVNAGTAGHGGDGAGFGSLVGRGGSNLGGSGGSYGGYSVGGNGGTAANGTISIGGGGGGCGYSAAGGRGGDAVGGIFNTGTLIITGSSLTGHIAAGGGGGGGAVVNSGAAGNGGNGTSALWNKGGVVHMDAATYATIATGNAGAGGSGGQASAGAGTNGVSYTIQTSNGGVTDTAYVVNTAPTAGTVTAGAVGQANVGETSYSLTIAYADSDGTIDGTSIGTADITVSKGATNLTIASASWNSTSKIATYTATPPGGSWDDADNGTWTIAIVSSQVKDNGGAYVSANASAGSFTVSMDTTAPTVSSVAVPANGTYRAGQNLDFTVNFSEAVTVNTAGGTPYIGLALDTGGSVRASYVSGSGTSALTFRYTIAAGNLDANGITVGSLVANGGTLADAVGNNVTLTLNSVGSTAGVVIANTLPKAGFGTALALESSRSEGVQVAHDAAYNFGTGSFTIEAWVKRPANTASWYTVVGKQDGSGGSGFYLRFNGNSLSFAVGTSAVANYVNSPNSITDAAWHHVAAVHDAVAKTVAIYIDGVLDCSSAYTTAQSSTSSAALGIGFKPGYGEYFDGSLDDVRIWNVARTPAQIGEVMRTPLAGTETGLVSYWTFEEGFGTSTADKSGHVAAGTLQNAGGATEWAGGSIAVSTATTEDTPVALRLGGVDLENQSAVTAVITAVPSHGTLYQTNDGTTLGATVTATAALTDTGGTPRRVIYVPANNYNGTDTFTYKVNDGSDDSANTVTVSVTVLGANDLGTVTNSGGNSAFVEGNNATSTPVAVDGALTLADVDNTTFAGAKVTISGNYQSSEDVLGFVNDGSTMGNVNGTFDAGTGVLTLVSSGGTATVAQWQSALRSVTYTNSSDTPNTANRTISFTVDDGSGYGPASTKTVTVSATNDAPVATASGGGTSFAAANTGAPTAVAVDAGLTVSDLDNSTCASATVTITTGFNAAQDVLRFTNTSASTFGNIVASYNATTGVLTLTSAGATATLAKWQAALRAVTYVNAASVMSGTARTLAFVINDGTSSSAATTKTVNLVADVPAAPTIGTATSGDEEASVTFTAPAHAGGAAITGYTVTSNPGGVTGTGTSSPITVAGLTNGVTYTFFVTATNSAGTSGASGASNAVTPKALQSITFNNPGAQNFGTTPTLTATATSGLPVTFTSATPGVATITSGGVLTFVSVGTATINADQAGDGVYGAAATQTQSFTVNAVAPGAPTAASAAAGNAKATVSFTAPTFTGGASITGYTVTSTPGSITGTGTSSPIVVTGLTNGTAYTFTVTATNSAGTGAASTASTSVTPMAPPVVNSALTASGTYGSAFTSYVITATNSPTAFTATGLPAGLSFSTTTGTISGTPTTSGTFNTTIGATNVGGTGTATLVITISQRPLSVAGVTANNKTYDGNTTATLNLGAASLSGSVVSGDTVTLNATGASASFATKTVGSGKTVTTAGFTLAGTGAANYALTQPTTTADITAATLTVTGITAANKTYNGDASATLTTTGASLAGVASGDVVTLDTTGAIGTFGSKTAGTGKTVTVTGVTASGTDRANYTLVQPTTTADITAKTLTVTGVTAANKTYDRTVTAALNVSTAALSGVLGVDAVTLDTTSVAGAFATATVGSPKTVTVTGLTLTGTDAANYVLTQPTTTAAILAKALTLTGVTAANKTYDGTTAATLNLTGATLNTVIPGDTVTLDTTSAAAAFDDANIGSAKTVTLSGVSLAGVDAANYALSAFTTTANITAAAATVTLGNLMATYDRTAKAATATTAPAGLAVTFTYDGTPLAVPANQVASFSGAIGSTITVNVTGSTTGTAYGSGPYAISSDVATAAVHAGAVAAGQTKLVQITISAGAGSYAATTANGVTTQASGAAVASFSFAGDAAGSYLTSTPVAAGDHAVVATVVDRNYAGTASGTLAIAKATLTVTGVTAASRTYDGGVGATLDTTAAQLSGVHGGDVVTLSTGGAAGAFATKTVGTGKTVTISGLSLGGADAANYAVTQPTTLADITAKTLTVTGVTAADRAYDGGLTATLGLTSAALQGVVPADAVTLNTTGALGAFATKGVGAGKTVTVSGLALAGTDAPNYTLTQPTTAASITGKPLTVTGVTAASKTYDGTMTASLNTAGAMLVGVVSPDVVTLDAGSATAAFATRTVGTGRTVTISGLALSGADAANYSLTAPTTTANITAKGVTVLGATAANKVYDGTLAATPSLSAATLSGVIGGDDVTLGTNSATAAFTTKTVAAAKPVSFAGLTLGGADAGNYALAQPITTADITAKTLTVTGITAADRVYDGTLAATMNLTNAVLNGAIAPDDVTLATAGATGAFATKTAGSAKPVTVSGLSLGGVDAANYTLAAPAVTATVTAKALSVTGITASNRAYDGTTTATLNLSAAALTGVIAGDTVTLNTGSAAGTFADAAAGAAKPVTVAGLTLGGADAPNYSLTAPSLVADITKATATVAITNTNFAYDGTPRAVTVTTVPTGLSVAVTYGGNAGAPSTVGTYAVVATVTDANYLGAATATLTITQAGQTVFFPVPSGALRLGTPVALSATASSGLPVTFSLISGNATLSGNTLTLTGTGAVVVRATQPGNASYRSASADLTLATADKLAQTIQFGPVPTKRATDAAFALVATASSGLPVSFTLVSGPAMLSGSQLTPTGVAGSVVVRASQAGDATYAAAPDVVQSFDILGAKEHQVFFGRTSGNDTIAIDLAPDGRSATLLCYVSATGEAFIVSITINADGTFAATVSPLGLETGGTAGTAGLATERKAAAAAIRTFTGRLSGGTIDGTIPELGLTFSASVDPAGGTTAPIAGFYRSTALNASDGITASIIGTQGNVLVVSSSRTLVTGGTGAVTSDGKVTVHTSTATITAAVNEPTATITGTIAPTGQPPIDFSGIAATTLRTDRLVNLSSRARVGPAANQTLITGFVIGGSEPKRVLLRGVGPTLSSFGVAGALSNPRLLLFNAGGTLMLQNDDWTTADAAAITQVGAFELPTGSRDAAIVATLAPGAYTVHVVDGGETGVVLAEVYDASVNPNGEYQRLVNISARGTVEAGDGVLIGGFVVTGNSPKKVLVRGIGPALAGYGVTSVLADPKLAVYVGQTVLARNDNWATPTPVNGTQVVATAAEIQAANRATGAFQLPDGSKDAAVVVTLAPGAYTAQVSAADGSTGVALVEVYELSE